MKSLITVVYRPVTLTHDEKNPETNSAPEVRERSSRKRRYSSGDRQADRETNYHVGSRYWGEDVKLRESCRREIDPVSTRTGGAYIPPAKLRMLQAEITDKKSLAYQRLSWEALKKSLNGLVNKVNVSNIALIVTSLMKENIVRGRGLLSRSLIQAQAASPTLTRVYASLVAVINSKFPKIGEMILTRLIIQFRRGFQRNEKPICSSSTRFIAHLVNQQVAHEVVALEILTLLLENATDDSVEVAVGFLKEVGQKLTDVSPRGLTAVFDRLRHVLHEANLDKRVKYMIEVMFQVRKDGFKDNPSVLDELDLVEEEDQFTHMVSIQSEDLAAEDILNVFKFDPDYEENEKKYQAVTREILVEDGDEAESSDDDSGSDASEDQDQEEETKKSEAIIDNTETALIILRRTIYLTIQGSLDHNECAHKMMQLQLKPGQNTELCHMILDCCAQKRSYDKFFGLLAQRFCQISKVYVAIFEQIFRDTYDTVYRLDANQLRNVGKMFAHLLYSDTIGWQVMEHIRITEEDTTSSSRVFLKILFQELADFMGLVKLNLRLKDPTLQHLFQGIFPRDDPRNTRFAINFFTTIGLGGLTDELRKSRQRTAKGSTETQPRTSSTGLD